MSATSQDEQPAVRQDEPPVVRQSLKGTFDDYIVRLRGGDVGALPAIAGLIVLVLVFTFLSGSAFTNAFNFANLILQGSAIAVFAMGLVFVLLLGEIDLSAGYTGGVTAAVVGILMTNHGWPWVPALVIGLLCGTAIGLSIGLIVARLGVPSFVVTLAAFLGLQGVLLLQTGAGGTIGYRNAAILAIMNKNMPVWLGWAFAIIVVVAYAGLALRRQLSRARAGLPTPPIVVWALKSGTMAVLLFGAPAYLSKERSRNV